MIDVNKENAIVAGASFVAGIGLTALGGFTRKKLKARKARKAAEKDAPASEEK